MLAKAGIQGGFSAWVLYFGQGRRTGQKCPQRKQENAQVHVVRSCRNSAGSRRAAGRVGRAALRARWTEGRRRNGDADDQRPLSRLGLTAPSRVALAAPSLG